MTVIGEAASPGLSSEEAPCVTPATADAANNGVGVTPALVTSPALILFNTDAVPTVNPDTVGATAALAPRVVDAGVKTKMSLVESAGSIWMSRMPAAAALPTVVEGAARIAALFLTIKAAVCAAVLPAAEPLSDTPINVLAAVDVEVMARDCFGN